MSKFTKTVKSMVEDVWNLITRYNDSKKWEPWANETALMREKLQSPYNAEEKWALKVIYESVLPNVIWQLSTIGRSDYNNPGIKMQLEAIRDYINQNSPKSEAEVPESTAAEKAGEDAEEREKRKKRVEELLQELRDLFKYFTSH